MFSLAGQCALVTGSSRGIGRAIALVLAHAGARVAVHGRTASHALEAAAIQAGGHAIYGDFREPGVAETVVAEAAEVLGSLDVLVNNAGIVIPRPPEELTEETWDAVLGVNLKAAFFCSKAAQTYMRKGRYGRIVNVSSAAAEAAIPSYLHYGVSKASLNIMTKYLPLEWAEYGITVNAVAPAFINTEMARDVFKELPELFDAQVAQVPKRRMGEVDEVAAAVLYLVSREADFTTGEVLHVDGGYLAS